MAARALATLLLAAAFGAGCSAKVHVLRELHGQKFVEGAEPVAHLYGETSGVYFLYFIPLCTGDPQDPGHLTFFSDGVATTRTAEMVLREAERLGGDRVTDLSSYSDSVWGGGTLFLFWYKWTGVSANVSRTSKEKEKKPRRRPIRCGAAPPSRAARRASPSRSPTPRRPAPPRRPPSARPPACSRG